MKKETLDATVKKIDRAVKDIMAEEGVNPIYVLVMGNTNESPHNQDSYAIYSNVSIEWQLYLGNIIKAQYTAPPG